VTGLVQEKPIDLSLESYVERRALELALAKASTDAARTGVQHLLEQRAALEERRAAHALDMTARRHARGEVYSDAKVDAINRMMPSKAELERNIQDLYARSPDAAGVLERYAVTSFPMLRAQRRTMLSALPADAKEAARAMEEDEERFRAAWIAAIGSPTLVRQLKARERELVLLFRTASRPMFLVTTPASPRAADVDGVVLGKAWSKLDQLCGALGVPPLSDFVGLDGQAPDDDAPAAAVRVSVDAVCAALAEPGNKVPGKKATRAALELVSAVLREVERGRFEVDL